MIMSFTTAQCALHAIFSGAVSCRGPKCSSLQPVGRIRPKRFALFKKYIYFSSVQPKTNQVVPRLRKFKADLKLLNTVLTDLISRARLSAEKADLEDLQERNYDKVSKRE